MTLQLSRRKEGVMKDKKSKIITWIILIIICVLLNIYLVGKLPFPEHSHLKVIISLLVFEIIGINYLLVDDKQYKADMITVTPDIRIPAPAGQGQHGAARFLKEKEIPKTFDICVITEETTAVNEGGLVLGKKDMRNGKEQIFFVGNDTHTITLGSTRSGKTRNEVLETIGLCGMAGESMVITDIKGELHDYTAPYLRDLEYEVYVIDYDEQNLSDHYNLLQPVNDFVDSGNIPAAIDVAWDIVSQLVGEPKGEPIWNNGECAAIAGAIMAVCYDNRQPGFHKYRNLTNVYHFLVEMCTPISNQVPLNDYRSKIPDNHPCKAIFAANAIAPSRTRGSFYTSALMTLRLFTNPNLYNVTRSTDFNPSDLGKKKMAVFIILPEDRSTYNTVATLFVSQMYSQLSKLAKSEGGRLPVRVEMICDEFGNFAKIPDFTQMLTVAGGKGIRFHLFLQDYAQLDTVYGRDAAKTIRNNCETKIYLRSADEDTREIISKDLGEYTTSGYSLNYNRHRASESSSNSNLVGRRLLTAEEIGRINRPYSLVMRTSYHPAIMYAPDLSEWSFNERFGMGNETHNIQLRMKRHGERKVETTEEIELWGIWKTYQARTRQLVKYLKEQGLESGGDDE